MGYLTLIIQHITQGTIFLFFHKSLIGDKIVDKEDARREFEKIEKEERYKGVNIAFYGHTHEVRGFRKFKNASHEINFNGSEIKLDRECRYLINPGSIGMPNKGKPPFGIFDTDKRIFEVRYLF